jgi:hypothetical protein
MTENEISKIRNSEPDAGFLHYWNSPSLLPHPGPLPLGEGEWNSDVDEADVLGLCSDWLEGSLSQRERAEVREKLHPLLVRYSHSATVIVGARIKIQFLSHLRLCVLAPLS